MGKCVKNILISVIAAIMATFAFASPVFADPEPTTTNPDTTVTTPAENPSEDSTENSAETETTPEEETTPAADPEQSPESATTDSATEKASCYEEVGSLGWIICPGAGLFGKVIDGAYDLLTSVIEVNPLPTDSSTPTYIVWDYFKNITNIIFVIFFLVVIFSQLTGIGINNYGIKKILPRLIITAILVNLSYIICTIAVDLSNILGHSFQDFFANIQEIAVSNGNISTDISGVSVSGIVAAILGIGGVGVTAAVLTMGGGVMGIIWLLLPILLAGVVAVLSALVTMAARQSFIFLLVMVAPLAFVAYMLPNTDKWFKRWYSMLFQMLIFYPVFSILYGASQLAGLVIITTAAQNNSMLGVVLGIAVKILPLFMSIPLMRMSNSALGAISGIVGRMAAPGQRALDNLSAENQARAKHNQITKQRPKAPTTMLAQRIERRRAARAIKNNELAEQAKLRYGTLGEHDAYYTRSGHLSRFGYKHLDNLRERESLAAISKNIENDFNEGFKSDGTDTRIKGTRNLRRIARINEDFDRAIVDKHAATVRERTVDLASTEHRADLIRDRLNDQSSDIHRRVLEAFNINVSEYDRIQNKKEAYDEAVKKVNAGKTLNAREQAAYNGGDLTTAELEAFKVGQKAITPILSDAIAAKRKVDSVARSNYLELFNDHEAGPKNKRYLEIAFDTKDYNAASAAIEVMYQRGDKDDIGDVLARKSNKVLGEDNIRFQKELNDICLTFKAEDLDVAQWAKANMMRRGMNGKGAQIESFIDYKAWVQGETLAGDIDDDKVKKTSRIELGKALSSWEPIATADRTMWNQMLEMEKNGLTPKDIKGNDIVGAYPIKYLRSAVCSGRMDGERLESFNKYFTGGYNKDGSDEDNKFFFDHAKSYADNILAFLGEMSAPQLATLKTATITQLNDAMIAIDGKDPAHATMVNGTLMNNRILNALQTQIEQLNTESSMASQRTGMNVNVRKMLGIGDFSQRRKP